MKKIAWLTMWIMVSITVGILFYTLFSVKSEMFLFFTVLYLAVFTLLWFVVLLYIISE